MTIESLFATGAADGCGVAVAAAVVCAVVGAVGGFGELAGFFGARVRAFMGAGAASGAAADGSTAGAGVVCSGIDAIARVTLRVVRARGVGALSGVVDWARAGALRDGFFFSSDISATSRPRVQKRKY
jgi:hypothetical protein